MKITLICHGKTHRADLKSCLDEYTGRMGRYTTFEMKIIPDIRTGGDVHAMAVAEGLALLKTLGEKDVVALLDDKGTPFNSEGFATFLQTRMNASVKHLVFVVGGAYGFSEEVYRRADFKISLSPLTFSHQVVRLLFMEQLYRAFTIIRGEPYHHS